MILKQVTQKLLVVYTELNHAQQVAAWLLEKLTGQDYAQILLNPELVLSDDQQILLERWLDQIIVEHKPVQYILGSVPFLDLDVLVQAPVLIPRIETEYWVDLLIARLAQFKQAPLRILDLCTGSGCIGLALAKFFINSQVMAVDISKFACDLTRKNKNHNLINNFTVIEGDLFANLADQKFDLIVSNPPYVPADDYQGLDLSVQLWEDRLALVAPGYDLAIVANIIEQANNFLQNKYAGLPQLWIEIDTTQGERVGNLMQAKFMQVEVLKDQFGRQRVAIGR